MTSTLRHMLLLASFCALLFLPGLSALPVVDRDEAHFVQASRQMLESGNYFAVRFQDRTRFQKPPGINWLQAATVKLEGSALSVIGPYRVPSFLGALCSVLMLYGFSRRPLGERVASIGSLFFSSALLLNVESHMAVIDTALLASVVLMQGALWRIWTSVRTGIHVAGGWVWCFWLAMAAGFVLKGVTPLVGILTIVGLSVADRNVRWVHSLRPVWGTLLFLALTLAWLWPLSVEEHRNYLSEMLHRDLLPKLRGGHESHGKPPLFHLLILPLTFWPASLFLWQGFRHATRFRADSAVRFLIAWIVPSWIFFELMPTKLPQYVLPLFPAIALLCAAALDDFRMAGREQRWFRVLLVLWGVLSLGLGVALWLMPMPLIGHTLAPGWIMLAGVSVFSVMALSLSFSGRYREAASACLLAALSAFVPFFGSALPAMEPLWLPQALARAIPAPTSEKPLLVAGYDEPSLVFVLGTRHVRQATLAEAVQALVNGARQTVVVERRLLEAGGPLPTGIDRRNILRGFNYSKGRWVELVVLTTVSGQGDNQHGTV